MGLTIAYSLLASLAVAVTVVPSLAATVLGKIKEEKESGFFVKLGNRDEKILDTLLKRKIPVLLFVFLLFGASIYLALSKGTAFMPEMDSNQLTMTLTFSKDNTLEETAEATDKVIQQLEKLEDIANIELC